MNSGGQKDIRDKPVSHEDFAELGHSSLFFWGIKRIIEKRVNYTFQEKISVPIQNFFLKQWVNNIGLSNFIEKIGLPRQSIELFYGEHLDFKVNPHTIDRLASQKNTANGRKLTNFFIWDGDWDKNYTDFSITDRYFFISDIWNNREDLTQSLTYKRYLQLLTNGTPYRCTNKNHSGVLLNDRNKIHRYLEIYLSFMLSMKENGYDPSLTNDPVGVAIDRDGKLVKINKGLHRLAMAQVIDMEHIDVRLRAVHRNWWNKITRHILKTEAKFKALTEHLRKNDLLF